MVKEVGRLVEARLTDVSSVLSMRSTECASKHIKSRWSICQVMGVVRHIVDVLRHVHGWQKERKASRGRILGVSMITNGYFVGMLRFSMPRLVRRDRQVVDVFRHVLSRYMSSGHHNTMSSSVNKTSGGRVTSYGRVLGVPNVIEVCVVETR